MSLPSRSDEALAAVGEARSGDTPAASTQQSPEAAVTPSSMNTNSAEMAQNPAQALANPSNPSAATTTTTPPASTTLATGLTGTSTVNANSRPLPIACAETGRSPAHSDLAGCFSAATATAENIGAASSVADGGPSGQKTNDEVTKKKKKKASRRQRRGSVHRPYQFDVLDDYTSYWNARNRPRTPPGFPSRVLVSPDPDHSGVFRRESVDRFARHYLRDFGEDIGSYSSSPASSPTIERRNSPPQASSSAAIPSSNASKGSQPSSSSATIRRNDPPPTSSSPTVRRPASSASGASFGNTARWFLDQMEQVPTNVDVEEEERKSESDLFEAFMELSQGEVPAASNPTIPDATMNSAVFPSQPRTSTTSSPSAIRIKEEPTKSVSATNSPSRETVERSHEAEVIEQPENASEADSAEISEADVESFVFDSIVEGSEPEGDYMFAIAPHLKRRCEELLKQVAAARAGKLPRSSAASPPRAPQFVTDPSLLVKCRKLSKAVAAAWAKRRGLPPPADSDDSCLPSSSADTQPRMPLKRKPSVATMRLEEKCRKHLDALAAARTRSRLPPSQREVESKRCRITPVEEPVSRALTGHAAVEDPEAAPGNEVNPSAEEAVSISAASSKNDDAQKEESGQQNSVVIDGVFPESEANVTGVSVEVPILPNSPKTDGSQQKANKKKKRSKCASPNPTQIPKKKQALQQQPNQPTPSVSDRNLSIVDSAVNDEEAMEAETDPSAIRVAQIVPNVMAAESPKQADIATEQVRSPVQDQPSNSIEDSATGDANQPQKVGAANDEQQVVASSTSAANQSSHDVEATNESNVNGSKKVEHVAETSQTISSKTKTTEVTPPANAMETSNEMSASESVTTAAESSNATISDEKADSDTGKDSHNGQSADEDVEIQVSESAMDQSVPRVESSEPLYVPRSLQIGAEVTDSDPNQAYNSPSSWALVPYVPASPVPSQPQSPVRHLQDDPNFDELLETVLIAVRDVVRNADEALILKMATVMAENEIKSRLQMLPHHCPICNQRCQRRLIASDDGESDSSIADSDHECDDAASVATDGDMHEPNEEPIGSTSDVEMESGAEDAAQEEPLDQEDSALSTVSAEDVDGSAHEASEEAASAANDDAEIEMETQESDNNGAKEVETATGDDSTVEHVEVPPVQDTITISDTSDSTSTDTAAVPSPTQQPSSSRPNDMFGDTSNTATKPELRVVRRLRELIERDQAHPRPRIPTPEPVPQVDPNNESNARRLQERRECEELDNSAEVEREGSVENADDANIVEQEPVLDAEAEIAPLQDDNIDEGDRQEGNDDHADFPDMYNVQPPSDYEAPSDNDEVSSLASTEVSEASVPSSSASPRRRRLISSSSSEAAVPSSSASPRRRRLISSSSSEDEPPARRQRREFSLEPDAMDADAYRWCERCYRGCRCPGIPRPQGHRDDLPPPPPPPEQHDAPAPPPENPPQPPRRRRRQNEPTFGRLQHIVDIEGVDLPNAPAVVVDEEDVVYEGPNLSADQQVDVQRGENFTLALYESGVVVFQGFFDGGSTASALMREAAQQPITLMNHPHHRIVQVAIGPNHVVMRSEDGNVFTVGRSREGQLGVSNPSRYRQSALTPEAMHRPIMDDGQRVVITDIRVEGNTTVAIGENRVEYRCGEGFGSLFAAVALPVRIDDDEEEGDE